MERDAGNLSIMENNGLTEGMEGFLDGVERRCNICVGGGHLVRSDIPSFSLLEICPAVQMGGRLRSGIRYLSGDGENCGEGERGREANGQIYRQESCLPGCAFDPEVTPEIYICLYLNVGLFFAFLARYIQLLTYCRPAIT